MKLAVLTEPRAGERRVAVVPDTVSALREAGLDVEVEAGAGAAALATDRSFEDAGATVVPRVDLATVDVLAHVAPLAPDTVDRLRPGAVTVGFCAPGAELATARALRDAGVTAFAMELVPRISRAQSMDALTSQALVAGYRCALEAATRLPRFLPLFMTAAGTVPPARALVLGAGVAGLQAIATVKRLGAVVSAYDVRSSSADEVRSMGATFVELGLDAVEGAGGYARELGEERAARQRELLAPHVADADVLLTTAAVPGRRAPLLVTAEMLARMRPGSVAVDLAAESGGNVEGAVPGRDVTVDVPGGTVTVVGMADAASTHPVDASRLYARNVAALLAHVLPAPAAPAAPPSGDHAIPHAAPDTDRMITPEGGPGGGPVLAIDLDDEIVAGACLTHDGAVRHAPTAELLAQEGA